MASKELSEAIRAEMESALIAAGVWEIGSMGWVDAETMDPETVGHAMWQTDPPLDIDWTTFAARHARAEPPGPPPAEWLKLLAISGADFEGLIKAARLSIGLFLIQTKIIRTTEFSDDDFFELHWMSAVIYLATAAERLREFFVAAAFRQTQAEYRARGRCYRDQERARYATPFLEALELFRSSELSSELEKLNGMASSIQTIRDKRNELVHELATSMGHRERQRLSEQHQRRAPTRDVSFAEMQAAVVVMKDERTDRMAKTTKELADWYALLLSASNEVFVVEHGRRQQQN
jgi:hypothetical protein